MKIDKLLPSRRHEWLLQFDFDQVSGCYPLPICQEPNRVPDTLIVCFYIITWWVFKNKTNKKRS